METKEQGRGGRGGVGGEMNVGSRGVLSMMTVLSGKFGGGKLVPAGKFGGGKLVAPVGADACPAPSLH